MFPLSTSHRFLIIASCILSLFQISIAQDANHLSLIEDGAGLFNERGFLKSNSFSLDGNEIINNYNGNLIYSQGLKYNPVSQNGVHSELRIAYNGSVGHMVNSSLGSTGGQYSKQQNVNLPEWIISMNNIAIQTFNFENEVISWATTGDPDTISFDQDVAALITGYHSCYIHTTIGGGPTFGTISILMGDGSVLQFKSVSAANLTSKFVYSGEYRTFSKEDRTRGYVDPVTSEFTLFFEDGNRVNFQFYQPIWENDVTDGTFTIDEHDKPKMYLPVSFEDRFGNKVAVSYDSSTSCDTKIYGRPVVAKAAGFTFDWKGLLNGWQAIQLDLWGGGISPEFKIKYLNKVHGATSACGGGNNRGYVTEIIDAQGRTTKFDYEYCKRFGENFGSVPFGGNINKRSGKRFLLYPVRLFNITNSDGGITHYSYYKDPRTEWPSPGTAFDSLVIDLEIYCAIDTIKPCIKSTGINGTGFDSLGRDPYFTNMVVEKTREDSGVFISRDSLLFDWADTAPFNALNLADEFITTRFVYGIDSSDTVFLAQRLEFNYKQFPEKGDFSTATRDRGWSMKLINQETYEFDGDEVSLVSQKSQVWDLGICGGYCDGTLFLTQSTTITENVPVVQNFSYEFGDFADTNNLLKMSTTSSWNRTTENFYNNSYLTINSDSSYYTNTLIDSTVTKQGTTLISKSFNEMYDGSDSLGFAGQTSRSVNYIVQSGTIVDSLVTFYEYIPNDTYTLRKVDNGAVKKIIDPKGDSTIYHYRKKDKTPPGYDNKGSLDSLFCPVLALEDRRDGTIDTLSRRFDNNGPFWWKSETFLSNGTMITYDTTYDTTYAGDMILVRASASSQGGDLELDTIEVQQIIQYTLILPVSFCEEVSYAKILMNGIVVEQIACSAWAQTITGNLGVDIGDIVTVSVYHESDHGGTYMAEYQHAVADTSVITIVFVDTVPDAIVSFQHVDGEGKLKEYVDPHLYISEVWYDNIDRAKRVILPGSFGNDDYMVLKDSSFLAYPSLDGETFNPDGTGSLLNCDLDTMRVEINAAGTQGHAALISFEDLDLSIIDSTYLDSAFLTVFCMRSGGILNNMDVVKYHSVYPFCGGPPTSKKGTNLPNWSIPDTGFYKLDITTIVHWWLQRDAVPEPVQTLALIPKIVAEETDIVLCSNNYFDFTKRPKLEIFFRYNTKEDSIYTMRYDYDDILTDSTGTNVAVNTKADTTRFSQTSRVWFDGFSRAVQAEALDSVGTYDSTRVEYDFADRAERTYDQLNKKTTITRLVDIAGNQRTVRTTFPDDSASSTLVKYKNSGTGATGLDTMFTFVDTNLYVTKTYNENGDSSYEYSDILGRLRLRQRFLADTAINTYFDYDEYDNLTLVIKPEGDLARYWYNSIGWLEKEWCADFDTIFYKHDKKGNVISKKDGNMAALDAADSSNWIYFDYDPLNRLIETGTIEVVGGTDTISRVPINQNFYDQTNISSFSMGRLSITLSNNNGYQYGEKYNYDTRGRLTKQTNYFDASLDSSLVDSANNIYDMYLVGDSFVTSYTYDMADRVTSLTFPDGMVVTYDYDQRGRLWKVGDAVDADKYSRIKYTTRDKIDTVFLESGMQTINYAYNQRGWLKTINEGTAGSAAPQDLFGEEVYYYVPPVGTSWPAEFNGNIMGQKIAMTGYNDGTLHYQYDNLDRLLDVDSLGFEEFPKEDFVYDHNGNRLTYFKHQSQISTDTFNYKYLDGTNLLDSVTGDINGVYAFDANGNMAADVFKNAYFDYDAYNRMDTVTFLNLSPLVPDNYLAFGYSPGGGRIFKHYRYHWQDLCGGGGPPPGGQSSPLGGGGISSQSGGPGGPGGPGGQTCTFSSSTFTYYIRSKGKVIAEYGSLAPGANPTHRFIYAGDQRIAMRTSLDKLHYYLSDHLGSTRLVIDSVGNIMDKHTYYSFGQTKSEVTATGQSYKYTGKPLDDEGGLNLHYYGARYYDGASGRFCAVDPLAGKYPSSSPFVYTLNNPMKYVDADGREVSPVPDPTYRGWYSTQTNSGRIKKWAPGKSKFGKTRSGGTKFHGGVDLYSPVGTNVVAPATGTVSASKNTDPWGTGGQQIYITYTGKDGKKYTVQLMHLNSRSVKSGDKVKEGQLIGKSGQTGNAKGQLPEEAHVHMQIVDSEGNPIDPATVIEIETPTDKESQTGKTEDKTAKEGD